MGNISSRYRDDFNLFAMKMNGLQTQFTGLIRSSKIVGTGINEIKPKRNTGVHVRFSKNM